MDSAAFYIGSGETAELIAWVSEFASPGQLNDWPFIDVRDESYSEGMFRRDIRELMHASRAGMHAEWVMPRTGEDHLHASQVINARLTRWQYAYVKGSVHVFCEGYLMAQVFPHGARKHTPLPHAPAEREEVDA